MPRIPYYDVEQATGKHAEFLGKLKPHLNIFRMLANSEYGLKGFVRMGNRVVTRPDGTTRESVYWEMTREAWRARKVGSA